jgi:hypothetical protein
MIKEMTMTEDEIRALDRIMTDLAVKGHAFYAVPYSFAGDWVAEADIRSAAKDEGVQVRFSIRSDGAYKVSLRKVGRGH